MSRSLSPLLPAPDEAPRCAEHARSIGADPGGSAIRADLVVLVAVPLPWPKPALDHPTLTGIGHELVASPVPVRLLAAVPRPGAVGHFEVTAYRRRGGSAVEQRFDVPDTDALAELGRHLAAGTTPDRYLIDEATPARPAVLICTQGSHDVCCGSEGVRLARALESDLASGDGPGSGPVTVHRVSHTGGHRFAPTAMTLPDGRMWGGLDTDLVQRILTRDGDAAELVPRCRGWWGADTGPAQVAERAVFATEGWALDDLDRRVEVVASTEGPGDAVVGPGGGEAVRCTATVTVTTPDRVWEVEVVEGREVPTIACRQPGGLPAKSGQEYEVRSVRLVA
jgi:hypothetical protein